MQHLARSDLGLKGIVLAGLADLKTELIPMLSMPLSSIVIKVVDIAYSGVRGFHQAIDEASDVLRDVPLVRDKALISRFMEEIAKDTNKYTFGVKPTLSALEMGVVESVIVWEKLPLIRYRIVGGDGREAVVVQREMKDKTAKVLEKHLLVDWLVENCGKYGAKLHMVGDITPEGHQFCVGFGGVGAFLRYALEMPEEDEDVTEEQEDVSDSIALSELSVSYNTTSSVSSYTDYTIDEGELEDDELPM